MRRGRGRDIAIVGLRDGQPQSASGVPRRISASAKALEQVGQVRLRYSDSGILDFEDGPAILRAQADADLAAGRRELDGVVEEVSHRLAQLTIPAQNEHRTVG
jgi:hypothetical protein